MFLQRCFYIAKLAKEGFHVGRSQFWVRMHRGHDRASQNFVYLWTMLGNLSGR